MVPCLRQLLKLNSEKVLHFFISSYTVICLLKNNVQLERDQWGEKYNVIHPSMILMHGSII